MMTESPPRTWADLDHAYGSAADIPGILERIVPDVDAAVWGELWSRLCHQGTVYSASYAALPVLAAAAATWAPQDRVAALVLAGGIAGSVDYQGNPAALDRSEAAVVELRSLTEETLRSWPDGADEVSFLYLLQALMAFEDVPVWGRELDRLADEEFEVCCPGCGLEHLITISAYGYFASAGGDVSRGDTPLEPAAGSDLDGIGARLHGLSIDAGQASLAEALRHLFGTATCTACAARFSVADQVIAHGS